MRWADIEVPNRIAAMDARMRSACYPQRTFYPLSYGPSTRDRRITRTRFRARSRCPSRGQAGFYPCARRPIANRPEPAFVLLRYSFGGDRPSQTNRLAGFPARLHGNRGEVTNANRVVFHRRLPPGRNRGIDASHLSYAVHTRHHCQGIVKVHGVFPSCCGEAVSSPPLQFHRVCGRDSAQVVTPFMHVGTYPTRNFATLGPS